MTDALIPDTALVPVEEFRSRLPEGWGVLSYRAEISHDWPRETRTLEVALTNGRVCVSVEVRAMLFGGIGDGQGGEGWLTIGTMDEAVKER